MELIDKVKEDLLKARKSKNVLVINALSVLVADAERKASEKEKRQPTDTEMIALIRKMIENAEFTRTKADPDSATAGDALAEIRWLKQYLPVQLSRGEMYTIIMNMSTEAVFSMASVMQHFKANFPGRYDGKELSAIVKEILAK